MASMSVLWDLLSLDCSNALPGGLSGFSFDESRSIHEPVGASRLHHAAASLLRSVPKKFQDEIDQESADKAAFTLFKELNDRCKVWKLDESCLGPYDEVVLGEIRKTVWDFFNPDGFPLLDLAVIEDGVDFGPGNAPGARGSSYLDKIGHSKLTASSQTIIDIYYQWVGSRSCRLDCEFTRVLALGPPVVTEAVKISPVPKTAKISRLVKPEPLLNMFFQKGIQKALEARLWSYFGIDLAVQPDRNSRLARCGSIDESFSTLDLTSASDCISMGLCDYLVPRSSLSWLKLFRSKSVDVEGEVVPLHMIATMGNAFCFPLQTALFASVVTGCYKALGIPIKRYRQESVAAWDVDHKTSLGIREVLPNWAVFGDDIVVEASAFDLVVRMLKAFGFIPNLSKSFTKGDGYFRESCGADYYKGTDIRGVYVKSLKTTQDRTILINSLVDWSARHDIPLPWSISYLLSTTQRLEVPPWENPDSGIRVPLDCVRGSTVFKAINPPKEDRPNYFGSYIYKKWVPVKVEHDVSDETVAIDNGYWNSSAIYMAALKGSLRDGKVGLRNNRVLYRKRVGVAPCWDHIYLEDKRLPFITTWYRLARLYFGA